MNMGKVVSFISIFIVLGLLYLISNNRNEIKWKTVLLGLVVQFILAFAFLKIPIGQQVLESVSMGFQKVVGYSSEGIGFVFGSLADSSAPTGSVFGIQVLGTLIFFGALFGLLQYTGILGFVIKTIGGVVGKLMGTSKAESFVAVANIFLGQTDSPLIVSKYLGKMTKSEIMTVLVSGMGSIAGSVLVSYSLMGIPIEFMLIASILVPVGSIVVSKLIQPEVEGSVLDVVEIDRKAGATNLIDSVTQGAMNGLQMALGVGASLIAVVSLVALINGFLGIFGVTLAQVMGILCIPFGWMLGISGDEIHTASQLLGQKMVLNEFIAFSSLSTVFADLSTKAQMVISIALCGFANISSIAICSAGISILAPEKRKTITSLATKGMIGGALVSFLSALVVGVML